jgi:hypothetical protein
MYSFWLWDSSYWPCNTPNPDVHDWKSDHCVQHAPHAIIHVRYNMAVSQKHVMDMHVPYTTPVSHKVFVTCVASTSIEAWYQYICAPLQIGLLSTTCKSYISIPVSRNPTAQGWGSETCYWYACGTYHSHLPHGVRRMHMIWMNHYHIGLLSTTCKSYICIQVLRNRTACHGPACALYHSDFPHGVCHRCGFFYWGMV